MTDFGYLFENVYPQLAEKYDCNVTIYHFADRPGDEIAQQHFIVVEKGDRTETELKVTKNWLDGNNTEKRSEIEVQLYEVKDGVETVVEGKKLTLNETNNWTAEFKGLPEYDENNELIYYTVKEIVPEGYKSLGISLNSGTMGSDSASYTITNVLLTDIKVVKEWDDQDDFDGYRPTSLNVTLYANGISTGKTITLDANNNWTATFEKLHKYDSNGNEIKYTVQEETVPKYEKPIYTETEDSDGNIVWKIKNKHNTYYDGYIEITGKVWEDMPDGKANTINGIIDEDENGLEGIKVTLKDKDGNQFDRTSTATTDKDGNYRIKINYDNSQNVYKLYADATTVKNKLTTAYVEFEYDGLKYTTVNVIGSNVAEYQKSNQSKAKEDITMRDALDKKYLEINSKSPRVEELTYEDKKVLATTKNVITDFETYYNNDLTKAVNLETTKESKIIKYCNGNGTYIKTNPDGAWNDVINSEHTCENCSGKGHSIRTFDVEVNTIKNVNLGLYKREQPDISIKETISEVEVIQEGVSNIYKYNAIPNYDDTSEDVKVQFANKQTYTYRRPVNPTSVRLLKETYNGTGEEAMMVYVTYAVTVSNESQTLTTKVNSIINVFDSRYTLESAKIGTTAISESNIQYYEKQIEESIYGQSKDDYTEIKLNNLDISIGANNTSTTIYLRYKVSPEAIIDLLNKDATLSNAVEIESYSTYYGSSTKYAEYASNGRNGKVYAGYDKDAHPGNAAIKIEEVDYTYTYTDDDGQKYTKTYEDVNVLKSTENLVNSTLSDGTVIQKPEDDTDIAPSFLLHNDKKLETVHVKVTKQWEDNDNIYKQRPSSITVNVKNGEEIVDTVELTEDNNWTHTFKTLLKYSNGVEIQYTIEEVKVEKYITEITGNYKEGFIIINKPETTTISGCVWEDKDVTSDDQRLGDGKYNDGESKIQNVKVELYEVLKDDAGNITGSKLAQHYNKEEKIDEPAVQYTGADGSYAFNIRLKDKEYFLKYTYGDDTSELTEATTIDGGATKINARNYKSTIITNSIIEDIMKKDYTTLKNENKLLWYKEDIAGYSIAVDNMQDRMAIEDLQYSNFYENEDGTTYIKPENMTAFSKIFLIPGDSATEIPVFNFGIIERPRENLVADKTITNFKIRLANGQELINGNPSVGPINYVKNMGGDLLAEIDTELIQGATMEVEYEVSIINYNEKDYDYEDMYEDVNAEKCEYITTSEAAKYYYYGDSTGLQEMKSTIEFVDYMDSELTYKENMQQWDMSNDEEVKELHTNGFISKEVYDHLTANQYKVLKGLASDGSGSTKIALERGEEHKYIAKMSVNKRLSNGEENVFDNNVEIIRIDGKTARTIKETIDGEQIQKTYKPGNHEPTNSGVGEQDADRVRIIITPPTGIGTYIMYTIVGLVALIGVFAGITFIKKKVLTK